MASPPRYRSFFHILRTSQCATPNHRLELGNLTRGDIKGRYGDLAPLDPARHCDGPEAEEPVTSLINLAQMLDDLAHHSEAEANYNKIIKSTAIGWERMIL